MRGEDKFWNKYYFDWDVIVFFLADICVYLSLAFVTKCPHLENPQYAECSGFKNLKQFL